MRAVYLIIFLIYLSTSLIFPEIPSLFNSCPPKIGREKTLNPVRIWSKDSSKQIDSVKTKILNTRVQIIDEISLEDSTASSLLNLKENIYIATINGVVYCLDHSMKTKWQYQTEGKISNSIIGTGDLVVVMTDAGDLFTINSNNGDLVQSIGIGETINSNIIFTNIEYNGLKTKGIVFGTVEGNVYCYELYSLEQVWENTLQETNVITGTFLVDNKLIVQTEGENYNCLNVDNGVLIWKWEPKTKSDNEGFRSKVVSHGSLIFITDSDGNLYSIDLLLGTENWNRKRIYASGSFYNFDKDLILHTSRNEILVIDPGNGKTKRGIKLTDNFLNSIPTCLIKDRMQILLGFGNGFICELMEKDNIEPIIYTGNSPVISLIKLKDNSYISVDRNGKLIEFNIK